ncbi:MAG: hypothetical protein GY866_37160 [Proteobacteria bacterium]|nr:hypothetical protein [Pseudomonadota bacterium]
MLILTKSEIKKRQGDLIKACTDDVFSHLDSGFELLQTYFSKAQISIIREGKSQQVFIVEITGKQIKTIKAWIKQVLETTLVVYNETESENAAPDPLKLPPGMSRKILCTVLEILTCGRDLTDNDYYYISDFSNALNVKSETVLKIIEQVQYEIRKEFFNFLLIYLDEQHCFQCAILLFKAIQADNQIHPAEFKYIENINQLLKNDQSKLEEVEEACKKPIPIESFEITDDLAVYLFKYMIEIVLCDQDFDPKESAFVQEAAKVFGFDKARQDEILQPVAATIMVKESLFPKKQS